MSARFDAASAALRVASEAVDARNAELVALTRQLDDLRRQCALARAALNEAAQAQHAAYAEMTAALAAAHNGAAKPAPAEG